MQRWRNSTASPLWVTKPKGVINKWGTNIIRSVAGYPFAVAAASARGLLFRLHPGFESSPAAGPKVECRNQLKPQGIPWGCSWYAPPSGSQTDCGICTAGDLRHLYSADLTAPVHDCRENMKHKSPRRACVARLELHSHTRTSQSLAAGSTMLGSAALVRSSCNCMYPCICACVRTCIHAYTHVSIYVCVCVYGWVCVRVRAYVHTCMRTRAYLRAGLLPHARACVRMRACGPTYRHTYIDT